MMTEGRRGRNLIWRLLAALEPEEPGLPRFTTTHTQQDAPAGTLPTNEPYPQEQVPVPRTVVPTDSNHLIPPEDKLLVFRALTGIDSVPALTIPHHNSRTAPNVGIYERVVCAEQNTASRYRMFSIVMNTCLAIQVIAAAAITALGAASGPHSAVTTFGALNTIMAGILTYLKGSGLPDRLKHYQNEWRNIREYIEQRERELCLVGCEIDVQEEILIVERMYEGVKREIEATKSGETRTPAADNTGRRSFLPSSQVQQPHQQTGPESPPAQYSKDPEKTG